MLRAARAEAPAWERKLAHYGLSLAQLRTHDIQHIASRDRLAVQSFQFDSELGRHWKTQAQRHTILDGTELSGMSRIPARMYGRDVPKWAHCDTCCRRLLLHLYPTLEKTSGNKYLRQCYAGSRHRAARMWLILYFSFRIGLTTEEIAEELHVTPSNVANAIYRTRKEADKLFQEAQHYQQRGPH
jgi:hypothetical protein